VLHEMEMEGRPEPDPVPGLRLAWSNPNPAPARRTCLAAAIERHLSGRDGLTEEAFLRIYSGAARS
jgi:hypothetical protein